MKPTTNAEFGAVNRIFAPATKLLKLDSPYSLFMNGASGKYEGAIVERRGATIARVVAVGGITCVVSTTPGRMLPTGDPIPGKNDAPEKFPPPPNGVPSVLTYGGAIAFPLSPKFGPTPPTNGNCTNGCPPAPHGPPTGRKTSPLISVVPLTRTGARIIAGGLQSVFPKKSCE